VRGSAADGTPRFLASVVSEELQQAAILRRRSEKRVLMRGISRDGGTGPILRVCKRRTDMSCKWKNFVSLYAV